MKHYEHTATPSLYPVRIPNPCPGWPFDHAKKLHTYAANSVLTSSFRNRVGWPTPHSYKRSQKTRKIFVQRTRKTIVGFVLLVVF